MTKHHQYSTRKTRKKEIAKDRKPNTLVSRVCNDLWAAMSASINSRVKC